MEPYTASNRVIPSKITMGKRASGQVLERESVDAKKIADHESAGFFPVGWADDGRINVFRECCPIFAGSARRQSQPVGLSRRG